MKFKIGNHVNLECSLEVGQTVYTDVGGYKTEGKPMKITDIFRGTCTTGVMVILDGYPSPIDSDWIKI